MELAQLHELFDQTSATTLKGKAKKGSFGDVVSLGQESWTEGQVVVLGVAETRANSSEDVSWKGVDLFREKWYALYPENRYPVSDLGNLTLGNSYRDTLAVLEEVVMLIHSANAIPVVLGGGQDLTIPMMKALLREGIDLHIGLVDEKLDIGEFEHGLTEDNFLSEVIVDYPNSIYDITHLGGQRYLIDPESLMIWEGLKYKSMRLGEMRSKLEWVEPKIRDCDLISFDLSSLQQSDFSSCTNGPNGLSAWETCQLFKYMGMADALKGLGIFGASAINKESEALLTAEALWCFLEGVAMRVGDYPIGVKENHRKYTVAFNHEAVKEIRFYQSLKSGRWWFEAPEFEGEAKRPLRRSWISCDYDDYQLAMENKIPTVWWDWMNKNA